MTVIRVTIATLAAVALAATLALLALAAPAASKQHAATGAYCPDKTSRLHDATVASIALKEANTSVKAKAKTLAHAKKTHKGVLGATKALRNAKGNALDAKAAAHDANAALADCG
jgi:hypothetical protein